MLSKFVQINNVRHLQLEMGYLCNQKCSFCYQESISAKIKMADDIWKNKLLEIYPNLKVLTIIGGEPTIMPNVRDLLELVLPNYPQIRIQFITNGKKFDQNWTDIFMERGEKVTFSINAASEDVYNKIVKGGDWFAVNDNIKRLTDARIKYNNKKLKVHASFVITKENYHQLSDFIKHVQKLAIDRCIFMADFDQRDIMNLGDNIREVIIDALNNIPLDGSLEVYGLTELAYTLEDKLINNLIGERLQSTENATFYDKICKLPWDSLHVDKDGLVSFCCAAISPIGSLNNSTINEIWNSSVARSFRRKISNGSYMFCHRKCPINVNPSLYQKKSNWQLSALRAFYVSMFDPSLAVIKTIGKLRRKTGL